MERDTCFFDSIYRGKLYSITKATNLSEKRKKEKLAELKKEIEEIHAYKIKADESFIFTVNNILKKISDELAK